MAKIVRFTAPLRSSAAFSKSAMGEDAQRKTPSGGRTLAMGIRTIAGDRQTERAPAGGVVHRATSPTDGWPPRDCLEGVSTAERVRHQKQRVRALLHEAAALLVELDASEQRLGWLLEDCADLLIRGEDPPPPAPRRGVVRRLSKASVLSPTT